MPEAVRDPVHVQPLVGDELAIRDRGTHRGTEYLRTAAGQRVEAGLAQRDQDVGDRHFLDAGDVRQLDRGERLDMDVRIAAP